MATAKKTAAKKTAPKKTAPKPRSDYTAGARVKVIRKGVEYKGFVTGVKTTPTGPFIQTNLGTKQLPFLHEARPKNVKAY